MFTPLEQKEAIYQLWDRVADCDGNDATAAMTALLEGACTLLAASNCNVAITIRVQSSEPSDPLRGWRIRELIHLWHQNLLDFSCKEHLSEIETTPSEAAIAQFRETGHFRGQLLRDSVSPTFLASDAFARHFLSIGVADTLTVTTPLDEIVESAIMFYRTPKDPRFTPNDLETAKDILRPMKWLQRRFALSYGLLAACEPITPTERIVLQQLLTDRSEKEIAFELGVSYQTVHKHVKQIYKKLGVSSRAGVAALWLGNGEEGSARYRALLAERT